MPADVPIRISIDASEIEHRLHNLGSGTIKAVTAKALNTIAKGGRLAIVDKMKEVFDEPRDFTLNAFYNKPAKQNDLTAWITTRDQAKRGTPAGVYLRPQIYGGPRPKKRLEDYLAPISGGQFAVPGPDLKGGGNGFPPGFIMQLLSRLNLLKDTAKNKNLSDRTRAKLQREGKIARGSQSEYFVGHDRATGRATGIFRLAGPGQVEKVVTFVPRISSYSVRLPVDQIVEEKVSDYGPRVIEREIEAAFQREFSK